MGVLTELKPLSASAKANRSDGGHIVVPSSPSIAANINNNFRLNQPDCHQQKKSSLATNTNTIPKSCNNNNPFPESYIRLPISQPGCEYQADNFHASNITSNKMKNTSIKNNSVPSPPTNEAPLSPSRPPPPGVPPHPYQHHWNPETGPAYPPNSLPYASPQPNFMPSPFRNESDAYPHQTNSSGGHNFPIVGGPHIAPPALQSNGGVPTTNNSNFNPSSHMFSKFPPLPPGSFSPPPPPVNSHLPPSGLIPRVTSANYHQSERVVTNNSCILTTRPGTTSGSLTASGGTQADCITPSSTISPNHNKVFGGGGVPSGEHCEREYSAPRGNTPASYPPPLCAGCKLRIMDKFYLCAVDAKWHSTCLKCVECGIELEKQMSCFEKDRQIFCKEDYVRMYSNEQDKQRQCSRCLLDIQPSDLVMKARNCLFHVECFRCARCDATLKKGDFFGMFESILYCQLHYELMTSDASSGTHPPSHSGTFGSDSLNHSPVEGIPQPPHGGEHDGYSPHGPIPMGLGYGPPYPLQGGPDQPPLPPPGGWYPGPPGEGVFPGPDYPYENNNTSGMLKKRRGRKKRKVDSAFAAGLSGYMDPSVGGFPPGHPGMDGGQMDNGKSKRARTSFKHHQLRIMRSHFQINQNPDSRELKMLSQKTGLDKKVLQVWFQNSRAKWRRGKSGLETGTAGSCDGNEATGGVGMPSQNHHSHSSNEPPPAGDGGNTNDNGSSASLSTLNNMMNNEETDSDSLMEGLPIQ